MHSNDTFLMDPLETHPPVRGARGTTGSTTVRHPEHQSHFLKPKSELRQERKDPNSELLFRNEDVKYYYLSPMIT
jgi:hypothetical protein